MRYEVVEIEGSYYVHDTKDKGRFLSKNIKDTWCAPEFVYKYCRFRFKYFAERKCKKLNKIELTVNALRILKK